ncbi:MAG: hypothetical protein Q8P27_00915 [Candidatus Peregrinibacteria bacterium]|nr:hypothetical protein [Candidatus Peregrinibacteria bacterium]
MLKQSLIELGRKHRSMMVLMNRDVKPQLASDLLKSFSDRYVDIDSGGNHLLGQAVGFALIGKTPFLIDTEVSIVERGLEMLREVVAIPSLNVKIIGLSDGVFDGLNLVKILPNITTVELAKEEDVSSAILSMMAAYGPVYLRLPLDS